jgi:hypothetical protein
MSHAVVYLAALFVVSMMSFITGEKAMLRTVAALFGAWVLNWGYVTLTGSYTPWAWFTAVDAIAAAVILIRPAGKIQGLIGVCFLVQIAQHIGYGVNYVENGYSWDAAMLHWQMQYGIGFIKLFLVGGWAAWNGKAAYSRLLRRNRGVPHPTHRASL